MRTAFHVGSNCPHSLVPTAVLRLAVLRGRVTGSYQEAWAAMDALPIGLAPPLAIEADVYRCIMLWEEGYLSTDACLATLEENAQKALGFEPERVSAVEIMAHWYIMQAQAGLDPSSKKLGSMATTPAAQAVECLAYAKVAYIQKVHTETIITHLQGAHTEAAGVTIPCFQEVIATHLALGYAHAGQYGRAKLTLLEAGLPIDNMPPFWERHQRREALRQELLWHNFRADPRRKAA